MESQKSKSQDSESLSEDIVEEEVNATEQLQIIDTTTNKKIKGPYKEVIFHTPVIIGNHNLPETYEKQVIKYQRGQLLHENQVPDICQELPNGMLIDFPLKDISTYVNHYLNWIPYRSDTSLIENLQSYIKDLAKQRKFRKFTQKKGINIFKTQWFRKLSEKRKYSVIEALERMRDGNYALMQDALSKPLLDLLIGRSNRPPKSIAKRYVTKERDVIVLRIIDKLKPKQISKRLKIPPIRVYRILRRFQQNIAKVLQRGEYKEDEIPHPVFRIRRLKKDDPERVNAIGDFIKLYGIREASYRKIRKYLNLVLPDKAPHSNNCISSILKTRYHLKYTSYNTAQIRYEDPSFDEKRLQVSRTLAQFILDGALIISIDESNIRSDSVMKKKWSLKPHLYMKRIIDQNVKVTVDELAQSDVKSQIQWNEITSELSQSSLPMRIQNADIMQKRPRGRPKGSRDKKPRVKSSSVLQSRLGTQRQEQQSDIGDSQPKKKQTKRKQIQSEKAEDSESVKSEGIEEGPFNQIGYFDQSSQVDQVSGDEERSSLQNRRRASSEESKGVGLRLRSSNQSQSRLKSIAGSPQFHITDHELTPVIEEQSHIKQTSTVKKPKSYISRDRLERDQELDYELDSALLKQQLYFEEEKLEDQGLLKGNTIQNIQEAFKESLGKEGMFAYKVSKTQNQIKVQNYSISLISAISQEGIVANQLVEGGIDSSVFENFINEIMLHVRSDPVLCRRPVVIFMDNARIHCNPMVIDSIIQKKGILLYNAQYSPSLNPVEQFFAYIKGNLQDKWIIERQDSNFFMTFLQRITGQRLCTAVIQYQNFTGSRNVAIADTSMVDDDINQQS